MMDVDDYVRLYRKLTKNHPDRTDAVMLFISAFFREAYQQCLKYRDEIPVEDIKSIMDEQGRKWTAVHQRLGIDQMPLKDVVRKWSPELYKLWMQEE